MNTLRIIMRAIDAAWPFPALPHPINRCFTWEDADD